MSQGHGALGQLAPGRNGRLRQPEAPRRRSAGCKNPALSEGVVWNPRPDPTKRRPGGKLVGASAQHSDPLTITLKPGEATIQPRPMFFPGRDGLWNVELQGFLRTDQDPLGIATPLGDSESWDLRSACTL